MALDLTDANAFRTAIRYDRLTKKGSVLDVVRLVTGCANDHASRNFAAIVEKFPDVYQKVADFKFPGQGQRPTPVAHLSTLIEIAWLCPGKRAKEFRRTGAVTMCRALGGDLSLVDEIRKRHRETTEEEREAFLAGTGVTAAEADGRAVVPADVLVRRYEAETARAVAETEQVRLETYERLQRMAAAAIEDRDRLLLMDAARNLVQSQFLVAAAAGGRSPDAQITISTVAVQLGARLSREELKRAGHVASRLYRERRGQAPPKHEQFCDGRVILANTYTESDRDLVEAAVREVLE